MARHLNRGEIWGCDFKPPDKRRPVVVLTRQKVLEKLRTVTIAPITSTIRGVPGEVPVGIDEGLKHDSVVNLDQVQTVAQARLVGYLGSLGTDKMRQVCRALAIATGCDT